VSKGNEDVGFNSNGLVGRMLLYYAATLRLNIEHLQLQFRYFRYAVLKVSKENAVNFASNKLAGRTILH
jgi:hypothetical protein